MHIGLLLSGLATAGLLMTNAPVSASHGEYAPSIRPDDSVYDLKKDSSVAFAAPDGSSYRYDGEWQGEYIDPQGRLFEGEWKGRVTRHGAGYPAPAPRQSTPAPRRPAAGAPYADADYDDSRYNDHERGDYDHVPNGHGGYALCLKNNGLTGAAIGAVLGSLAGNGIAGRGHRAGGTLVGAGIGGLLGATIEKAHDQCRQYRPRDAASPQGYSATQPRPQAGYGSGLQGGYYYPQQFAPTVTIISLAAVTTTTTTVTEEIFYETVRSTSRKKTVRKWKPKPACLCK